MNHATYKTRSKVLGRSHLVGVADLLWLCHLEEVVVVEEEWLGDDVILLYRETGGRAG